MSLGMVFCKFHDNQLAFALPLLTMVAGVVRPDDCKLGLIKVIPIGFDFFLHPTRVASWVEIYANKERFEPTSLMIG